MKISLTFLSFALILLFLLPGCYNDNVEDLYPFVACDSVNVTYAQTIAPIMTVNCNTCHSTALAPGGVITDSYTGLSIVAKDGRLWGAISHSQGFLPMPQNGSQLSDCDQGKIHHWINSGSPDN